MEASIELVRRLERLERENLMLKRWGLSAFVLVACFGLCAWKTPTAGVQDNLIVRQLEVVDARGVPLITLGPSRADTGGTIVLRDSSGDKRSWWETEPGIARIVFESPTGKNDERTIAGLSTAPDKARLSLLGGKGASLVNAVDGDRPSLALQDSLGNSLFSAPWHK